jgi:putative phosphoesterase
VDGPTRSHAGSGRVHRAATVVGVISDTHGLLRPAAVEALRDSALIVHAGDVGKPAVLDALRLVAPVTAVRGNVDAGWAMRLPAAATLEVAGKRIYILHNLKEIDFDPHAAGFDIVISGHSHVPKVEQRDGLLHVNPGSAGPRRFKLPIAIARIEISRAAVEASIVELTG